ncbi:MAG: hypothetical protein KBT27_09235 [Prevotellaceae bacterium]|nr:hypothetical protein [Candidatus Faecinaster equi]
MKTIFKSVYDWCEKMCEDGWHEENTKGVMKFCMGGFIEGVLDGCIVFGALNVVIMLVKTIGEVMKNKSK